MKKLLILGTCLLVFSGFLVCVLSFEIMTNEKSTVAVIGLLILIPSMVSGFVCLEAKN